MQLEVIGISRMSSKVITMLRKKEGHIHTQTALDFKLNIDVIARKDTFRKQYLLYNKRAMTHHPPGTLRNKNDHTPTHKVLRNF